MVVTGICFVLFMFCLVFFLSFVYCFFFKEENKTKKVNKEMSKNEMAPFDHHTCSFF